ncbi:hypothetical protein MNEG_10376 [Monoraphidium neglectum]|uniref:Uncharacterized protein n=1 Tax=Monoraphidium neglectum TaxID=145388 RepID=A0A0D2KPQ9_9CHLO|nr:hypothetical protein MNEG_10376 [Monoraphidium neglectum]KIY97588.1 hypothetical protein MNEG_10376 [Monoraphidium neglectum]|eukprot:XP_013896608.1 hypothetical protein MNEG_10376 [Monoraphidium neglectum]
MRGSLAAVCTRLGRKPVWEADHAAPPPASAAARAAAPGAGDAATTSPGRSKLAPGALAAAGGAGVGAGSSGFGGGGNPLLKAALNSGLNKISHLTQRPGTSSASGAGFPTAGSAVARGGGGGAASVKMRLKDYFVARSANEASNGGGTLT